MVVEEEKVRIKPREKKKKWGERGVSTTTFAEKH